MGLLTSAFSGWPRQRPGADPAAGFRWKHFSRSPARTADVAEMLAAGDDSRIVRALLRTALAAAPADYAVCHFPHGSAAARAAGRTGFVRLRRGRRVLVNPLRDGLEHDPPRTESWALTYGDVELP